MRWLLAAMACCALVRPAAAQVRGDAPPGQFGVPAHMLGFARYGELAAAALACGVRSRRWAMSYQGRLREAIRASRQVPGDVETALRVTAEYEAYARQNAGHDGRDYCRRTLRADDLAYADAIVRGRARFLVVRPAPP